MDEAQIIGYIVLAAITLGTFITMVFKAVSKITQPINDLRLVIQELKDCIKEITKENASHTKLLEKHREQIEELQIDVMELKHTIDMYHKKV
jgi:uncharacterized membrane protein (DUF106 family)